MPDSGRQRFLLPFDFLPLARPWSNATEVRPQGMGGDAQVFSVLNGNVLRVLLAFGNKCVAVGAPCRCTSGLAVAI